MHCCCILKRAKPQLIKPITNYAFYHSALRLQFSAPVTNNVDLRPVKRSNTLVRKHAVGDSKVVWKRVVLSNANGSRIDSNVSSSRSLVREAPPTEVAHEIAQHNSSERTRIKHTIKPPDAPKPGIIRRHFAKVKGVPVDHETKDSRTSPVFKMYITHSKDPAPRITRIRKNNSNVITTHVTKEIKVRYFEGYGAFVRKRTISNVKKRSPRLRYFDAVVLRAKTKMRDDKEFLRTGSQSDGETDATSSQVKDRASKGSQRGWATRSPSRSEDPNEETEDDRLERLQLQSLQHAIDDLTYAPPQKPVTFERLTMRQRLYRLRRRKFGSKSVKRSTTFVSRSSSAGQGEKD